MKNKGKQTMKITEPEMDSMDPAFCFSLSLRLVTQNNELCLRNRSLITVIEALKFNSFILRSFLRCFQCPGMSLISGVNC